MKSARPIHVGNGALTEEGIGYWHLEQKGCHHVCVILETMREVTGIVTRLTTFFFFGVGGWRGMCSLPFLYLPILIEKCSYCFHVDRLLVQVFLET